MKLTQRHVSPLVATSVKFFDQVSILVFITSTPFGYSILHDCASLRELLFRADGKRAALFFLHTFSCTSCTRLLMLYSPYATLTACDEYFSAIVPQSP